MKWFKKLLRRKGSRDGIKAPIQETSAVEDELGATGKTSSVREYIKYTEAVNKRCKVVDADVEEGTQCTDSDTADLDVEKDDFDTQTQLVSNKTDFVEEQQFQTATIELQAKVLKKVKDVKHTSDESHSEGSDSAPRTEHTLSNDVISLFRSIVTPSRMKWFKKLLRRKGSRDGIKALIQETSAVEDELGATGKTSSVREYIKYTEAVNKRCKVVDADVEEGTQCTDSDTADLDVEKDDFDTQTQLVSNKTDFVEEQQFQTATIELQAKVLKKVKDVKHTSDESHSEGSDSAPRTEHTLSNDVKETTVVCHRNNNEPGLLGNTESDIGIDKVDYPEDGKDSVCKKREMFMEELNDFCSLEFLDSGISMRDLDVDMDRESTFCSKNKKQKRSVFIEDCLLEEGESIMNKKKKECIESTGIYDEVESKGNEEETKEYVGKCGNYVFMEAGNFTDGWVSAICKEAGNNAARKPWSDVLEFTTAQACCHIEAEEHPRTHFGKTKIVTMGEIEDIEVTEPNMDKYEYENHEEGFITVDNVSTNVSEPPEVKEQFGSTISPDSLSIDIVTSGTSFLGYMPSTMATLQYKKKENQRRKRGKKFLSESFRLVSAGNHRGEKRKTKTPRLNEKAGQSKFKAQGVRNKRKVDKNEAARQTLRQLYPKGTLMSESIKRKDRRTSRSLSRVEIRITKRSASAPELAIENINEQLELLQQDSGYLSETIDSFITSLASVIKCSQSSSDVDYLKQSKHCQKLMDEDVNIQHRVDRLLSDWTYFRPYVASLDVAPGLEDYFQSLDNGQTLSLQEQMNIEWLRLRSLSSYQGNGSRLNLARNGFYHDSSQGHTSTRCVACNVEHSEWDYFSDIPGEHRRLSPNCPFVSDQAAHQDNVPIHSGASNAQAENVARVDDTQSPGTVAQTQEAQTSPVDETAGGYAQPQSVPPVVTRVSSAKHVSSASASSTPPLDKRSSGALTSEHQSANVDDISMALKRTDINSSVKITHEAVTQSRQPTEDAENQSLPRSSIYLGSNRFTDSIPASALRAGSRTNGPTLEDGGSGSQAGNQTARTRANDVPPILSEAGLTRLASKLGEEWAILILCLQLPFEIMQEMMAEHGSTETALPTTIKACLARWRDTHTGSNQDQVDQLLNALIETGRTELVTYVRQYNQDSIPASALRAGSRTNGPTLEDGGSGSQAGNQTARTRANDVPPILSEAGLTQLASKLGEEWAILILCLQLPFEIMQEMMAEHGSTETALPTTIKACLARWRDTHTGSDQDQVDQLLNALIETGRTELVTYVRQYNQADFNQAFGDTHPLPFSGTYGDQSQQHIV